MRCHLLVWPVANGRRWRRHAFRQPSGPSMADVVPGYALCRTPAPLYDGAAVKARSRAARFFWTSSSCSKAERPRDA